MILKTLKEHKILTIYCFILFILIGYVTTIILFKNIIGLVAYYQYFVFSIFCLLLGIPILLFALLFLYGMLKGSVKAFPSYFMKRKMKMTKKGKKSFKDDCFILIMGLFVGTIGLLFVTYGTNTAISSFKDYAYLSSPVTIDLFDYRIEYRNSIERRGLGGAYRLYGYDMKNNEYDFIIGKYPDEEFFSYEKTSLKVYYLPYSKVVMEIK